LENQEGHTKKKGIFPGQRVYNLDAGRWVKGRQTKKKGEAIEKRLGCLGGKEPGPLGKKGVASPPKGGNTIRPLERTRIGVWGEDPRGKERGKRRI